jgi:hypothetical protein
MLRLTIVFSLLTLLIAACQDSPPVQYLMEVTREVTVVVVVTATPEGDTAVAQAAPTQTVSVPTPAAPTTAEPNQNSAPPVTEQQPPSPTPDVFPTDIAADIIVAEQDFQRGRMFYLQPASRILVLLDGESDQQGTWTFHEDTWEEGMPELDPELEAPEGLFQPERGFGKLWRENEDIQEALGWAMDAEVGFVSNYRYEAGGQVNAAGEYEPGPGVQYITDSEGQTFILNEADGTWFVQG